MFSIQRNFFCQLGLPGSPSFRPVMSNKNTSFHQKTLVCTLEHTSKTSQLDYCKALYIGLPDKEIHGLQLQ